MNRSFYILLLIFMTSSCGNEKKRLENEKNILGDWIQMYRKDNSGEAGFSFYANHTYDNKDGFFKQLKDDKLGRQYYLGSNSKFRLSGDSLYLFRPDNNGWHAYKIFELTATSLKFGNAENTNSLARIKVSKTKTPEFNKIVLSTSDCLGPCPISSTVINSDGTIMFSGLEFATISGLYTGNISKLKYNELQDNFRKMDFDSLKSFYDDRITDQQTTSVTFVKNGEIYKTVHDYARVAPLVFRWAYVPLENLYQQVPLHRILPPSYMLYFDKMMNVTFINGDKALRLEQSETFLLMEYLQHGKICNKRFAPRYEMHGFFTINKFPEAVTDGRYYTFEKKGKPTTVDIGFNFYDINAKNWQWQKANKYD